MIESMPALLILAFGQGVVIGAALAGTHIALTYP